MSISKSDSYAAAGVDVSHVSVDPNESSGVGHITLEVTDDGAKNRITVCPGANFTLTVDDLAWLKDQIGRYDLVMMQFELPMEAIFPSHRHCFAWQKPGVYSKIRTPCRARPE